MGEPQSEFTPEQLDRLEDALEDLEGREDWMEFEDAPALRERLEAYQEVMAVSRKAMPMEEVPAGLLDSVIAQARDEAVVVKPPEPEPKQKGRLGRWLVPVLGLAGGAAAVLLIFQVGRQMDEPHTPDGPELARAEQLEAEVAAEEAEQASERGALNGELDDALALADEAKEDEEAPLEAAGGEGANNAPVEAEPEADPKPAQKTDKTGKPGGYEGVSPSAASKGNKEKAEAPQQVQGDEGIQLDKDELYDLLAEADKKRRQGRCGAAESRYKQVIVGGADPMAKARAKAGLGLCAEFNGDLSGADKFFSEAKAGYAGISSWIETERAKMPAATETKKSKSRPKKKAAEPAPEAVDSL